MKAVKAFVVLLLIALSGCVGSQKSGSVTHKKSVTELPDGTKTTSEETAIIQPEGSKTQTSYAFTQEPFSMSGVFGSQYDWESVRQKFKAMKPFIWVGILVVFGGVFCWVKKWCDTKVGIVAVTTGIGSCLFGTLMPVYGVYVFWGLAATGIGVVAYILWRHGKS